MNGLGNVVVGYDEAATSGTATCNLGEYWNNQGIRESAGGVWSISHWSGSHKVVVGGHHSYSR